MNLVTDMGMTSPLRRLVHAISGAPGDAEPAEPSESESPSNTGSAREHSLDETIESTFPASDPPSTIPAPEPDLEHTGDRNVHEKTSSP
jgi:hypothetical protein